MACSAIGFARDGHVRPDADVETLARLRPVRLPEDPEATVTAGNASGQNDGAAICIVTTPERAAELGLRPLVGSWADGKNTSRPPRSATRPVPSTGCSHSARTDAVYKS
jgi:acetyl-CoA C-acetyltransferase